MMEPRIVIAYRTILETAAEFQAKADAKPDAYPNRDASMAAGLEVAAATIYGTCKDDGELKEMLDQIKNVKGMSELER